MDTRLTPKFAVENEYHRINCNKKIQDKFCRRPPLAGVTPPAVTSYDVAARRVPLGLRRWRGPLRDRADFAIAKSGLKGRIRIKGFTLVEVIISAGILVFVLSGLLAVYANLFLLGDINRQLAFAVHAAQVRMEELKNTSFDSLAALNGTSFDIDGFDAGDAEGVVTITNTGYSDLLLARVVVCFRQKGQRIIGEDRNLNGILDGGEDTALVNGRIDSPVEVVTLISR